MHKTAYELRIIDCGSDICSSDLLNSVPTFRTAPLLGLVFGLALGWLRVSGWRDNGPAALILPSVALALPTLGAVMKLTRSGLADVLDQDFVRTARAKGLSPAVIRRRNALRPALMPEMGRAHV